MSISHSDMASELGLSKYWSPSVEDVVLCGREFLDLLHEYDAVVAASIGLPECDIRYALGDDHAKALLERLGRSGGFSGGE